MTWRNSTMHPAASLRQFSFPLEPAVRLVCFPNAGAGASVYRRFLGMLPSCVELLSVQLPGREDRLEQPAYRCMQFAADDIGRQLAQLPAMPTVFFGHSMGAVLAFETARTLAAYGGQLRRLIVSGDGAPDLAGPSSRARGDADDSAIVDDLRRLGGTPPALLADPKMRSMILRVVRADYILLDHYRYEERAPLTCGLIACAARDDPEVSVDSVAAWGRHTSGEFHEHWFDGDHFYLFSGNGAFADRLRGSVLAVAGGGRDAVAAEKKVV